MFRKKFQILFSSVMLAAGMAAVQAATLTVTNLENGGDGSLRHAIGIAAPGDTIEFQPGLAGTIVLQSALPLLDQNIRIIGPGPATISVSGNAEQPEQPPIRVFEIESGAEVEISGLTITNGRGDFGGGGISNRGRLTLSDCIVSNNAAEAFSAGGGIDNFGGTLLVDRCVITGNFADTGGGIANDGGAVSITDSTIFANHSEFLGGGIDSIGDLFIERSAVFNNSSEFGGGIGNGDVLMLLNSTVSGNTALETSGGIDNFGGSVDLVHSTVASNQAAVGGGGLWTNGLVTAKNSLVVGSADSGGNCAAIDGGVVDSAGVNLDTDGSCGNFQTVTSLELALEALADNGGPTETHALQVNSVAVDAASDCTGIDGLTVVGQDQRGIARPQGSFCDIGAFELADGDLIFADGFESG
ncbi:MAG: choice-of-anchor Q domain-containing protein [Wenzhouxiangellaceae bacterium]|nr:choice-of-anchor Q domain-containing protein [Wenzhouxiangellaceae bacterium]